MTVRFFSRPALSRLSLAALVVFLLSSLVPVRAANALTYNEIVSGQGGGQVLGAATPALVQTASGSSSAAFVHAVSVAFPGANTAGNLIVVAARSGGASGSLSLSVSDTAGNTYAAATGDLKDASNNHVQIFYAKNIRSGSNTVTVEFTSGSNPNYWVGLHEYSGLDTAAPLDVTRTQAQTSATALSSGAVATTNANDLLFGFTLGSQTISAPGSGFTQRLSATGIMTEDQYVTSTGSYAATFTQSSSGNGATMLAAFKSADTTPAPPTISSFTASPSTVTSGGSSTLSWNAPGATSVSIAPGSFTSASASGSTIVNPTSSTTYTLTATNDQGSVTAQATVTVSANPPPSYTITASAGSGGSISPSGSVSVSSGGSQSFSITANSGYQISGVTVDGSSVGAVSSYSFNNVTSNHSISASFTSTGGGGGAGWNLTFQDEFNDTALDTATWDTAYAGGGCTNNDEQECYQAANVTESGGQLHLTARQQTVTQGSRTYNYTSGMIQNRKAFSQTYGYMEARIKVPKGQGFWPAFWTLPSNGGWPPEIDVIELGKGGDFNTARMTLHWGSNGNDNFQENTWSTSDLTQAYHTFAVDWEPGSVIWYVDGVQRAQMNTSNVPSLPMYLLANLAVGGSYPGNVNGSTPFPSVMDIDYIRAYTKVSSGACYSSIPGPTDSVPSASCGGGSSDTTAPSTPANLSATAVSSSQINLSWSASTDNVGVTGYRIYRNGTQIATTASTSYNNTGLSAGTSYSYTVSAYDAAGNNSSQSSSASATTQTASQAPAISSFTASPSTITSGGSATLSWTVSGSPTPTLSINNSVGTVTGSSVSVSPTVTTTYTLTATNSAGSVASQATVTVGTVSPPANGAPVIFFTDITSGPATGGENGSGAFVTLYGNNFGSSPTVTIGGQSATVKLQPTSWLWYQKLAIQIPSSVSNGATTITVTNGSGTSNSVPFTVRAGNIYFAGSQSGDKTSILACKNALAAGDICYVRNGMSATSEDNYSASAVLQAAGSSSAPRALITYPGATATIGTTSMNRGVYAYGGSYWIVAGFNLRAFTGFEMVGGNYIRAVGNDLYCPNGSGQSACIHVETTQNTTLYGNYVHDTGVNCGTDCKQYHTVYFTTNSNHDEVGWNELFPNYGGCRAIQFYSTGGADIYDVHVHDNYIHDGSCDGINFATVNPNNGPVEAYNNVVKHIGTPNNSADNDANKTCVNLWSSSGTPSTPAEIYNNTFYDCGSSTSSNDAGSLSAFIKTRLRNNIFYQLSGEKFLSGGSQSSASNLSGSNNIWYGVSGAPSQTTGNITSNPQFANASGADFHLTSSSPAINAGASISGLNMDIEGNPRSSLDIGAYEYASSSGGGGSAPTISSFSSSPASITYGNSSTLSWNAPGATSVSITPGSFTSSSASGSTSVSPTQTTTYTLSATNSNGSVTAQTSVTVNINPDTTAPTASLTSPSSGTYSGSITLSATASDPTVSGQTTSGLFSLSLLIDGTVFATSSTGSISRTLDTTTLSNASHAITARAQDNAGNTFTTSAVSITVNNAAATKYPRKITLSGLEGLSSLNTYPSLAITILSPSNGSALETQTISPDASHNYTITFLSSDPQLVNIRIKAQGYLSQLLSSIDTTVNSGAAISVPQLLAGDLNNDNVINSLDYSVLNTHYNQNYPAADINQDNIVNSFDYAVIKNNWNRNGG